MSERRASLGDYRLVQERLASAGVQALFIKGAPLAALLGREPGARLGRDIDILLRRADIGPARQALAPLGYVMRPRGNGIARERHLVHEWRPCVDLHWNLAGREVPFPLDWPTLWRERGEVVLDGVAMPVPGLAWSCLFSCFYLLRDAPAIEARYLDDLAACLPRLGADGWRDLARLAARTRTRRLCGIALHLTAALRPVVLPDAALNAFPVDAAVREGVAECAATFASGCHPAHQPVVSELRRLLVLGRYREAWRDRLTGLFFLPAYFLATDAKDAGRAVAEGRPSWRVRLDRAREVRETVLSELRRHARERGFRRLLADPLGRVRPRPDVEVFFLDESALLLEAASETLLRLDTVAAYVWCALAEGAMLGAVEDALASELKLTPEAAASSMQSLLWRWWSMGLLEGSPPVSQAAPSEDEAVAGALALPILPAGPPARRLEVTLLDRVFTVELPDRATEARVVPLLAHLASNNAGEGARSRLTIHPLPPLGAEEQETSFAIGIDGEVVETSPSLEALGPQVKSALTVAAINRHGFALYVHAAMLRPPGGRGAILMPAAPGSGKTCLSAALAKAGFAYHTDEVTLLLEPGLEARGLPVALTVKEPAWPVLADRYPRLAELPAHLRIDGRICKYLPPPVRPGDAALDAAWPVGTLVFPRYAAGEETRLARVDRLDGLCRLLEECLAFRISIDSAAIARLVEWIAGIEVFELLFSNLDEAVRLLEDATARRERAA